jgi:hypothetical protein
MGYLDKLLGTAKTQINATQDASKFASSKTMGEKNLLLGNKNIQNALTPKTAVNIFSSGVQILPKDD